jgi:hypothetical protein
VYEVNGGKASRAADGKLAVGSKRRLPVHRRPLAQRRTGRESEKWIREAGLDPGSDVR